MMALLIIGVKLEGLVYDGESKEPIRPLSG